MTMTLPAYYDLTILQGANLDITFTWKDSVGDLVNLTGYTARMKIKSAPGGTEYASWTSAAGEIVLGGAAGTIQLLVSAAATALLSWTEAVYDLELVSGAGVVTRLVEGKAKLSKEVTA